MPGDVVYACTPTTWEAEAGRPRGKVQPRLQSETLYQKQKQNKDMQTSKYSTLIGRNNNVFLSPNFIFIKYSSYVYLNICM
jgi:hypothetical protein